MSIKESRMPIFNNLRNKMLTTVQNFEMLYYIFFYI